MTAGIRWARSIGKFIPILQGADSHKQTNLLLSDGPDSTMHARQKSADPQAATVGFCDISVEDEIGDSLMPVAAIPIFDTLNRHRCWYFGGRDACNRWVAEHWLPKLDTMLEDGTRSPVVLETCRTTYPDSH